VFFLKKETAPRWLRDVVHLCLIASGIMGAATKQWILQRLHHETVLALKGGFQNKCAK
jgi:hypothetical protein